MVTTHSQKTHFEECKQIITTCRAGGFLYTTKRLMHRCPVHESHSSKAPGPWAVLTGRLYTLRCELLPLCIINFKGYLNRCQGNPHGFCDFTHILFFPAGSAAGGDGHAPAVPSGRILFRNRAGLPAVPAGLQAASFRRSTAAAAPTASPGGPEVQGSGAAPRSAWHKCPSGGPCRLAFAGRSASKQFWRCRKNKASAVGTAPHPPTPWQSAPAAGAAPG